MEILEIRLQGYILHIIYKHNGIKIKDSSIVETKEDVVKKIENIIKNPTI